MAHLTRVRRGANASSTSNSTSWTPAFDYTGATRLNTAISDGERVIWLLVAAADGNPTLSETGGNGWTKVGQASNGTVVTGALFTKETTTAFAAGEDPDFVLGSTASEQYSAVISAYRAAAGKTIGILTPANSNGSSTNSDPASITNNSGASQDVSVWVTRSGDSTVVSTAAPTNYGNHYSQAAGGTSGASSSASDRQLTISNSSSEDPGTFTSNSEQWVCWTVGVYEAPLAYSMAADPGSYTMTGTAAALKRQLVLTADNGSSLITNGTFSDGSGWTLSGTPNPALIDAGLLKIPSGNSSLAYQDLPTAFSYPLGTVFVYSIDRVFNSASSLGSVALRLRDVNTNISPSVALGGGTTPTTFSGTLVPVAAVNRVAVTGNGTIEEHLDNLSLGIITYSVTGTAATFNVGVLFPGDSGSYVLTGSAATLYHGWKLAAAPATFALTGTDATLTYTSAARVMVAEPSQPNLLINGSFDADIASWSSAGSGATLSWVSGRLRVTKAGVEGYKYALQTYDFTGTTPAVHVLTADFWNPSAVTAFLTRTAVLPLDATSTALEGSLFASFQVGVGHGIEDFAVGIDTGSGVNGDYVEFDNVWVNRVDYALTGTNASLEKGLALAAAGGTYSLTGTAAGLLWKQRLVATGGTYSLTGAAANLIWSQRLVAAGGAYALTGSAATFSRGRGMVASGSSYTLSGTGATFYHGWKLAATAGSYALTGAAASFLAGIVLSADSGSYTLTGAVANFLIGQRISASPGSYAITGTAASFLRGRSLAALSGSYLLSGTAAVLFKGSKTLTASPGTYVLTGISAFFTVGDISDMVPQRRQLVVFRHQEAEIVRVPKLNAVAAQAAVPRAEVVSMAELAHIAPLMGLEVHVWDAPGGYTPVFGDGFSWRRVSDGSVLWPTPGGMDFLVVPTRSALAAATGQSALLLESGRQGIFIWNDSDFSAFVPADTAQGFYVAPATDTSGASGAWVRRYEGPVNPLWFGIVEGDTNGANGTANSNAMTAMLTAIKARAVNLITNYQGLEWVKFPVGEYEFALVIDLTDGTILLEGSDTGMSGGRGTIFKFPAGVTGIRTQLRDTSGADTTDGVTHKGGNGSVIRHLSLFGGYLTGAPAEAEAHGIHLRSRAEVSNVFISNFEGDGIYSNANATIVPKGNTNNSFISNCRIEYCRNGVKMDGNDANIWLLQAVDASLCRQWGFWDSSVLGNTFVACHTATNGYEGGALDIAPTMVSDGTNRYGVIAGQEVGASTNAPSGTTADNTWWYFIEAGGVTSKFPLWVSGTTYRAGGSFCTDNANARAVINGCYAEDGQGLAQISTRTTLIGGMASGNVYGRVASLRAFEGAWLSAGHFRPGTDNLLDLGRTTGRWRVVYGYTGDFQTEIKVNGVKVLGAQGAAVADATGGATVDTEARAAINALLARLRTHGVIAT